MTRIKTLPLEERPRERLLAYGTEVLSTSELLAVILGSGTKGKSVLALSQELLAKFGSLKQMKNATLADLCRVKGMGRAKAIQLKAALGLASRLDEPLSLSRPIESPSDAYQHLKARFKDLKKEHFGVLLLDAKNRAFRWEEVSVGTLIHTLAHPREVFHPAIKHLAASLILAHNHPSGDPTPSEQDIQLTKQLIETSQLMGIPIQDHLILGGATFVSLRELNYF